MISTVTTSTVSIVTFAGFVSSLAFIGILVLLALLVQKELATASSSSRLQKLNQALNIGIFPLLIAFILIAAFKVMDVLQ